MKKNKTSFKIHVHRANLHDASKPKKWYVHLDAWGPNPYEFKRIVCNVPVKTIEGGLADVPGPTCGCANAWLEGVVEVSEVSYLDQGDGLQLGK